MTKRDPFTDLPRLLLLVIMLELIAGCDLFGGDDEDGDEPPDMEVLSPISQQTIHLPSEVNAPLGSPPAQHSA